MTAPADARGGAADAYWMQRALRLGRRGLGRTWPNPSVGCVLVDAAGLWVADGVTAPGGRPHAEAAALAAAGGAVRGATAYVTLEPCAHFGRSPPCADALIAAGVARVVFAVLDPDPRVDGGGRAALEAAGVRTELAAPALQRAAETDHAGFFMRLRQGRPLVTLKLATSLDGRIAAANGESRWITGPAARRRVHLLRAAHDAVLVGSGTALADDPRLDVRLPGGRGAARPVRVVADSQLRTPLASRLVETAAAQPLWLAHAPTAPTERRRVLEDAGAVLLETAADAGGAGLEPAAMLRALGDQGVTRVLCEGGGRLAAALLGAGCVDRLVLVSAGLALGADAHPAVGALGAQTLGAAPRFRLAKARPLGGDVWMEWRAEDARRQEGG